MPTCGPGLGRAGAQRRLSYTKVGSTDPLFSVAITRKAQPTWRDFVSQFDLSPPTEAQRAQIIAGLTPDERRVLLEHGTEAAFCGVFLDNHKDGIYTCRFCGLPLFRSSAKFDSGTGWPSFFKPYDESNIRRLRDTSYGMVRVEEVCARCGSHLGHVFPDGPPPTGERHCLNSVSLAFSEKGNALPDVLRRGPPEGQELA